MIRRLKRKYTFFVMCAVILVIGIIITTINIVSYSSMGEQLDFKLELIVENEGMMPDFPIENPDAPPPVPDDWEDPDTPDEDDDPLGDPDVTDDPSDADGVVDEEEEEEDPRQDMSPETPYETRYFTVKFYTDGTVAAVDVTKIAAIGTPTAERYATEMLEAESYGGYLSNYRYMRGVTEDGCILYVFLDANRELQAFQSFLTASIVISLLGILTVFAIVVLLSPVAIRPIIESYEKQKRFITDAGHEMKTPLAVISANTEIIEMESGESQWTEGIKSQVAKLADLTEKLVFLSKMEEGVKLVMEEFSVSEAFFDTCEQYKSIAMSKGVVFNLAIDEGVVAVGNEGEIRRCITLLLDNAFRYVNDGGYVSVEVRKTTKAQSGVEMKFTNSADEVERGSLDRWFDRFYRTDLSRNSATGGSGIGLSVVKAIVLAHGGTIRANSDDGKSVVFTINI